MATVIGMGKLGVRARANSHNVGGDFDHLVAYSMACTLKSDEVCANMGELALDHLMR